MAFAFKRKETVQKAVRRLIRKRVQRALKWADDKNQAEGIHGLRKEIKKIRAILRLFRDDLSTSDYRREVGALREIAELLASARDAHVASQALETIIKHFHSQLVERPFAHVSRMLHERAREAVDKIAGGSTYGTVKTLLTKVALRSDSIRLQAKGWSAIAPGIKRNYASGRKALETVSVDPTAENFHELRKRMKDLWYQLRLMRPVYPRQLSALTKELKRLTECMGDDHDLVVLQNSVGNLEIIPEDEMEALNGLIELRHQDLRAAALARGKLFYMEKPARFTKRLGDYWHLWRCGPKLK